MRLRPHENKTSKIKSKGRTLDLKITKAAKIIFQAHTNNIRETLWEHWYLSKSQQGSHAFLTGNKGLSGQLPI